MTEIEIASKIQEYEAKLHSLVTSDYEADYLVDWFAEAAEESDKTQSSYLGILIDMYNKISKRGYIAYPVEG